MSYLLTLWFHVISIAMWIYHKIVCVYIYLPMISHIISPFLTQWILALPPQLTIFSPHLHIFFHLPYLKTYIPTVGWYVNQCRSDLNLPWFPKSIALKTPVFTMFSQVFPWFSHGKTGKPHGATPRLRRSPGRSTTSSWSTSWRPPPRRAPRRTPPGASAAWAPAPWRQAVIGFEDYVDIMMDTIILYHLWI